MAQAEAVVPRFSQLVGAIKAWAAPWRKAVHLQNPLPSVCWHSPGVELDSTYPIDIPDSLLTDLSVKARVILPSIRRFALRAVYAVAFQGYNAECFAS